MCNQLFIIPLHIDSSEQWTRLFWHILPQPGPRQALRENPWGLSCRGGPPILLPPSPPNKGRQYSQSVSGTQMGAPPQFPIPPHYPQVNPTPSPPTQPKKRPTRHRLIFSATRTRDLTFPLQTRGTHSDSPRGSRDFPLRNWQPARAGAQAAIQLALYQACPSARSWISSL